MKSSRKLVLWSGSVAASLVVGIGIWLVRSAIELPEKAYAMWGAGDPVVEHLRLNTNRWPRNWSELERTYRTIEHNPSTPVHSTLEQIQNRVQIDWDVDVSVLAVVPFTNGLRPFRVIRLLDGKGTHYAGTEPNVAVWNYLQALSNSAAGRNPAP